MESLLKIVVVEPNKEPYIKTIENTLEQIQGIVEGSFEAVPLTLDNKLAYII